MLESLSSASTGVAPPAWPYVAPPIGGACAKRSFERSVSRWTIRTVCRSKRNDIAELEPTPSLIDLPVLARGVVDDRPPLHVDLAGLVDHQPVARLPGRRLGDVRELQPVRRRAREADLHVDEARRPPCARPRSDRRRARAHRCRRRRRSAIAGSRRPCRRGRRASRCRLRPWPSARSRRRRFGRRRPARAPCRRSGHSWFAPHIQSRRARARRPPSKLFVSCRPPCADSCIG